MEKKKEIFDTDLNSLMNEQLIDVEVAGDNSYPIELLTPGHVASEKDKAKEKAEKEAIAEANKDLIDLDKETEEEEEEKEDKEEKEIKEAPSSKEATSQTEKSKTSSPLTPYAKLLKDEGILPNLDVEGFDGSSDSLKEAMIEEIMGAVEMYKETLPDRVKNLINNYEDGIPFERLLEIDKIETDVSKITDESLTKDTSLQRKLVTDYLGKTTKFSEAKISKLVDGYEDGGELEDESKNALVELKKYADDQKKIETQELDRRRKTEEKQRKDDIAAIQDKIKTAKEVIPGLKINDKLKTTIFTSMTTPVGYDQAGRPVNKIVAARMENPLEFEFRLHYLFEITKGFTDFSKLSDKGKKDATDSFEQAVNGLDTQKLTEEAGGAGKNPEKSTDFLKGLRKAYGI
jgi:hypothetical protein